MTNNTTKTTKSWKLNFCAKPKYFDEYTKWIDAETKEDAVKKLEENFYGYDLEKMYLIGIKDKELV